MISHCHSNTHSRQTVQLLGRGRKVYERHDQSIALRVGHSLSWFHRAARRGLGGTGTGNLQIHRLPAVFVTRNCRAKQPRPCVGALACPLVPCDEAGSHTVGVLPRRRPRLMEHGKKACRSRIILVCFRPEIKKGLTRSGNSAGGLSPHQPPGTWIGPMHGGSGLYSAAHSERRFYLRTLDSRGARAALATSQAGHGPRRAYGMRF